VGAGIYTDSASAVKQTLRIRKEYLPDMGNKDVYDRAFGIYLELYAKLKDVMARY